MFGFVEVCICGNLYLWRFVFVFLAVFFCGVNPLTGFGELLPSLCICLFSCVFVSVFDFECVFVFCMFICIFDMEYIPTDRR